MATATSVLNLLFTVDGTTESVAKIQSFRSAINTAADDLTDRWSGPLSTIEGGITRIAARAQTDLTQGLTASAAAVGALTYAFLSLGKAFVNVNEQFASFEISLSSSLRSAANARKVVEEIARVSPQSPLEVTDLSNIATAISVEPQLRDKLNRQASSNQLNDPNSVFKQLTGVVEELTTLRPDRSTDSAVFAVRQALAGRFQSLERTFNLSPQFLTSAAGTSLTELKNQGPEAILNALVNGIGPLISREAIQQRTEQPSAAINNLSKQLFQLPSIQVGQAGLNSTIIDKLQGYLQQSSNFFNKTPGVEGSGAFETKGYASQLSNALSTIINEVTDKIANIADQALAHFGFGADKGSLLDRATQAIIAAFNYVADNIPKFIDDIISVGSKIGTIIENFVKAATTGINAFIQLTSGLGPTGTALAALAAPSVLTKLPALLLNKGLSSIGNAASDIPEAAKARGLAAVADATEASTSAAALAKQAVSEANQLTRAASGTSKLIVDEVSPMATAFQILTKEANAAAASMRGGAIRATEDIADALNLAGITAKSGGAIKAGQFVSQSILEQGADSAGARFAAKAAADQAIQDAALLAAANKAQIAEVNAVVAAQKVEQTEAAALAQVSTAGVASITGLIGVFAALAFAGWELNKAFTAFSEMRDAQVSAETSATAAQQLYVKNAIDASNKLSLVSSPDQQARLTKANQQTSSADDIASRIKDRFSQQSSVSFVTSSLFNTTAFQTAMAAQNKDIEDLISILKSDPNLKISKDGKTGNYLVSDGKDSTQVGPRTDPSQLGVLLGKFAADITQDANKSVHDELAKTGVEGYSAGRARQSYDQNAVDNGQSASKIADSSGFGQYRSVADIGSALSSNATSFTAVQDKLETARGEATKYAELMAEYNTAYAQKQQDINDELAKVKAIDVSVLQKSLLSQAIAANETLVNLINSKGSQAEIDKARTARDNYLKQFATAPLDKPQAINTLTAAQRALPGDLQNRLAAGVTLSLNQLVPTLKNSQANDPLAAYNIKQFQSQLVDLSKNSPSSSTGGPIIGAASKLGSSLLNINNSFDSTYQVGIQKYITELGKATATVSAYENYQNDLSASLKTYSAGSKDANVVQSALKAAEKDLAAEKSNALKIQREYDNFLKQGSIEQNALNAAVAQQKLDAQKAAGLHVTTADVRNAAANSATSNQKTGPVGSFSQGFASQFKQGDDQNNYADVGIKAAQSVQTAWGNAFAAMVTGTMSAKDAFRQMTVSILQDVAKMLAEKAAAQLIGAIVGAIAGGGDGGGGGADYAGEMSLANGGYIDRGSGYQDDVPIMAMRGEYVLTRDAVSAIGKDTLDKWNMGHMRVEHHANGGMVGNYTDTSSGGGVTYAPMNFSSKSGDSTTLTVNYHASGSSDNSDSSSASKDNNSSNHQQQARALKAAIIDTIQDWERKKKIRGQA